MRLALALVGCAACAHRAAAPVALALDTAPGLSDLAIADDGALWTVAERDRMAYRIVVDGDGITDLDAYSIDGVPDGHDLEAIAWIEGVLTFGTEGDGDTALVLEGRLADGRIATTVTRTLRGTADLPIGDNHGIESLCNTGLLGVETPLERDGARLAVLARDGTRFEVALTTDTGKLADVDCRGDDIVAIERHFGVSRIVRFTLGDRAATLARDVTDLAGGRNFEGIVRLADGRIALVNDNQYKTLDGPSQLVILPALP